MTGQADRDAACIRRLEAAGIPPDQARELNAQIREEVRALGPPSPEFLEEIYELFGVSREEPGRGAA